MLYCNVEDNKLLFFVFIPSSKDFGRLRVNKNNSILFCACTHSADERFGKHVFLVLKLTTIKMEVRCRRDQLHVNNLFLQ
jgi:hypothetical protein